MKLRWLRFLDWLQSYVNLKKKTFRSERKWGARWRDYTRTGRRYSRVEHIPPISVGSKGEYRIRPEPGWEWICYQCKTYSLVTHSMMPRILAEWEEFAEKTVARGFRAPVKPSIEMVGCPNCRFRPGDPE